MSALQTLCHELNEVRGDTLELAEKLVHHHHELISAAAHARTTFTNDPTQASEAAKEFEQAADACRTAAEHLNIASDRVSNFIHANCGSMKTHIITVRKANYYIDSVGGWHGKDGEYLTSEQNAAADEFLEHAKLAEPVVTRTLRRIIENLKGCKLIDFDKRLKVEYSFKRKLASIINDNPRASIQFCMSDIKDSVRYTVQIPDESHEAGVLHVVDSLYMQGYTAEIEEDNYWKNEKGYLGINSWWLSADVSADVRCAFEVQFHTERSYFAKTVTHPHYSEIRVLQQKVNEVYAKVPRPDGAALIEIFKYLKRKGQQ